MKTPDAQGGNSTEGAVHPTMVYGQVIVTIGWPLTVTRGLGEFGSATPTCEHVTIAFMCTRKPGIESNTPVCALA
jgi:hypothetical protein